MKSYTSASAGARAPAVIARFAVVDGEGRASDVWRVWTGTKNPTNEIYVATRQQAGDLKISLHSDGNCQFGLTDRARRLISRADRRALDRWQHGTVVGPDPLLAWLFQRSELIEQSLGDDVLEIRLEAGEAAVGILLVVADTPPDRGRMVASLDLKSGKKAYIVAFPRLARPDLVTQARRDVMGDGPSWRMPLQSTRSPFAVGVVPLVYPEEDGAERRLRRVWNRLCGRRRVDPFRVELRLLVEVNLTDLLGHDPPLPAALGRFRGDVRYIGNFPLEGDGVHRCGVLYLPDVGRPTLFVNEGSRCNHRYLQKYANRLVRRGPDGGWRRGGPEHASMFGAGWFTSIVTRVEAHDNDLDPHAATMTFLPSRWRRHSSAVGRRPWRRAKS